LASAEENLANFNAPKSGLPEQILGRPYHKVGAVFFGLN
jgi:hypothetical protein